MSRAGIARRTWGTVAVLMTFAAALDVGCGLLPTPSLPPVSSATPSSPEASPRPTASELADPAMGWTLVTTGDPTSAMQFNAVAAVPDGFVVAGSTGQAGENPVAIHSTDGASWMAEDISGRAGMSPRFLVPWVDGLLVTGGGQSSRCAHPGGEMASWVRAADGTWAQGPFNPVLCAGGPVTPVIHDGRPWLVGSGVADVPFLMDSADGLTWADHPERLGDVFVQSGFSAAGDLWVVARAPDGSALILRSPDGVRFDRTPLVAAGGKPVEVIAAVALRDRAVLLVNDGSSIGTLTSDGSGGWLETGVSGLPQVELVSVTVADDHLIALGSAEDKPQRAWSSADGSSWSAVELPGEVTPGATVRAIAIANGIAVLVGQIEAPDGSIMVGAIWTGPAGLLAP